MNTTPQPLRVGLIGFGYAGSTLHAPLIEADPGLTLAAVGSSKAAAVHAKFPHVLVCPAEVLATHPDVDLIVIATPNQSHFPLAAAALRAGKHVVVDKPFTVTLAEARDLREIARQAGRHLSVFQNRRWDSEAIAARDVLRSDALGEVSHFACHMDRFRPTIRRRWREDPGPGAGLWFDLGPHLIDLSVYLFGPPHSVFATLATLRAGGQTDDFAHVILFYDRLRVVLNATLLAATPGPRSTLHGTEASWVKYGLDTQEAQLKAGMSPNDPAFGFDPIPSILIDGPTGAEHEIPAPRGDQRAFYAGVREAILHGTPPPVLLRDSVAVMAILETTFASNQRGQILPIPLNPTELAEWIP